MYVSTAITVVLGVLLGLNGYEKIWALFGSANQLLAALGLLAVARGLATWARTQDVPDSHGLHDRRHHLLSSD